MAATMTKNGFDVEHEGNTLHFDTIDQLIKWQNEHPDKETLHWRERAAENGRRGIGIYHDSDDTSNSYPGIAIWGWGESEAAALEEQLEPVFADNDLSLNAKIIALADALKRMAGAK